MDRFESTKRAPALRQMLEALEAHREAKDREYRKAVEEGRAQEQKPVGYSAKALLAKQFPPTWVCRMNDAAIDGVGESLEASIREEGWRAYAEGELEAMHELADKACAKSPLSDVLDGRWDGIGIEGRRNGGVWVR